MHKILFACSEMFPLIKTGGLADVAGSLPPALVQAGHDVRVMLPAYGDVLTKITAPQRIASLMLDGLPGSIDILETVLAGSELKLWLVHYGPAFDRGGNPYLDAHGVEWPDNAARFALFSRVIARIGQGAAGLDWHPDIVHCNDWQTALAPALLAMHHPRPALVFTIHNLSYQGLYPYATFQALALPMQLWSSTSMEYYGNFSFIKGGLVYADMVNAVSPTYAREIQTPQFGYGLEGLLQHRGEHLVGIVNGIDTQEWNPETDRYLDKHFSSERMEGKKANKAALQQNFSLAVDPAIPVIGMIGRLVQQKGLDLVIGALPTLVSRPLQIIALGSGERSLQGALEEWAARYPQKIAVHIGYSETLAHRIEAGADMFLMPSRFEPCGLNQLYSQRYGTIPIVHNVGGLADTVVDASAENLKDRRATGIIFQQPQISDLEQAVDRGLALFHNKNKWRALQRTAMARDFSWQASARQYDELYRHARQFAG